MILGKYKINKGFSVSGFTLTLAHVKNTCSIHVISNAFLAIYSKAHYNLNLLTGKIFLFKTSLLTINLRKKKSNSLKENKFFKYFFNL